MTNIDLLEKFIILNGRKAGQFFDKFSIDSRKLISGQVFLSLDINKDKNLLNIRHAIENGACGYASPFRFTRKQVNSTSPFFVQENLASSVYKLFQKNLEMLDSKTIIIGITGTNGKTSTVLLLAQSLTCLGKKVGVISSEGIGIYPLLKNNSYTTPPIDIIYTHFSKFLSKKYDFIIIECSSQGIEQGRLRGIAFDYTFITNIFSDHLDYHKTIKNYAKAKLSIIQESKCTILNNDSSILMKELILNNKTEYIYVSNDISNKKNCLATYDNKKSKIYITNKSINIPDEHYFNFNIYSLLFICSLLYLEGFKFNDIKKGINNLIPLPGRRQIIYTKNRGTFVIDYAHTINSFEEIYKNYYSNTYVVTLFGCGGDRDKSKRKNIAKVVDRNSSFSIITEDNSRSEDLLSIINDIKSGFSGKKKYIIIKSRKHAIKYLFKNSKINNLNFILGKGNEDYIFKKNKKIRHNDIDYLNFLIKHDES